jgi:hypothetical protein
MNTKRIHIIIAFVFVATVLSGCATLMAQACTESAAFEHGYNDAKNSAPRNSGQYEICEIHARSDLKKSYSNGYSDGVKDKAPRLGFLGIKSANEECLNAYGRKVCGYGCTSAYGQVQCGSSPGDNCVSAYGQVRCGRNCRQEFGKITCN